MVEYDRIGDKIDNISQTGYAILFSDSRGTDGAVNLDRKPNTSDSTIVTYVLQRTENGRRRRRRSFTTKNQHDY